MPTAQRIRIAVALVTIFVLVIIFAYAANGQPSPSPAPFTISDEEVQKLSWDDMIATLKHARQKVADTLAIAAEQKDSLAAATKEMADALAATKDALVRLDAHDREVAALAAENERNKEESMKKDTVIAKKDATIFKLGAALVGLVLLIIAYVGLKLFTRLPIP